MRTVPASPYVSVTLTGFSSEPYGSYIRSSSVGVLISSIPKFPQDPPPRRRVFGGFRGIGGATHRHPIFPLPRMPPEGGPGGVKNPKNGVLPKRVKTVENPKFGGNFPNFGDMSVNCYSENGQKRKKSVFDKGGVKQGFSGVFGPPPGPPLFSHF